MGFSNRIKNLKQGKSKLLLKMSRMPLYWIVIVPFMLNILATVSLIEYFSARHTQNNRHNIIDRASIESNKRLYSYLYNRVENSETSDKQNFSPTQAVNDYLQQAEVDVAAKIIIFNKNGLVIASNYNQQGNLSSISTEKILNNLKQQLGNFKDIDRSEQFSLTIDRQSILGQLTPWQDRNLGIDWLTLAIVPESELAAIDETQPFPQWRQKYLAILLPITILGIVIYIWIALYIRRLSKTASAIAKGDYDFQVKNTYITEINQLEHSLSQIAKQLQTDRAVDNEQNSLLADMSHELRSPLNAILGFAQIMQQESSMTRSQRENLAIINRSGKRLLTVINDLVDLSKIATNRLTLEHNSFDFALWLENMEQSVKFQANNQNIEFSLIQEPDIPRYLSLDERRLRQVLKNLIDYSLRATQAGTVTVKVACYESNSNSFSLEKTNTPQKLISSEESQLITNSSLKPLNICFEIENYDYYISPEEISTLFNPIARVRQKRKSLEVSSLSMPISRQLAQLMGGDITVSNCCNLSQGFTLRLDIQAEANITPELQLTSTPRRIIGLESDRTEYRILVVDDSKTNRKIMVQLLEPVGFKVKEAVNGKEAVDIWLRWHPHMIWMDIRMPVMNGYEATEQIKSYPQVSSPPIVALTAGTLEEERSLFQAAGCDDFVGKPFSDSIIFDKIAQHLGVRYVYETIIPAVPSNFRLTADALRIMSDDWLTQVEKAAITLDGDSLTQSIQQIPAMHHELKEALQMQVKNFDFDRILNLARQAKSR